MIRAVLHFLLAFGALIELLKFARLRLSMTGSISLQLLVALLAILLCAYLFARRHARAPSNKEGLQLAGGAALVYVAYGWTHLELVRRQQAASGFQLSWQLTDPMSYLLAVTWVVGTGLVIYLLGRWAFGASSAWFVKRRMPSAPEAATRPAHREAAGVGSALRDSAPPALERVQPRRPEIAAKDAQLDSVRMPEWHATVPMPEPSPEINLPEVKQPVIPLLDASPAPTPPFEEVSMLRSGVIFLVASLILSALLSFVLELLNYRGKASFHIAVALGAACIAAHEFVRRKGRAPTRPEAGRFAAWGTVLASLGLPLVILVVWGGINGLLSLLAVFVGALGGMAFMALSVFLVLILVTFVVIRHTFRWFGEQSMKDQERKRAADSRSR